MDLNCTEIDVKMSSFAFKISKKKTQPIYLTRFLNILKHILCNAQLYTFFVTKATLEKLQRGN